MMASSHIFHITLLSPPPFTLLRTPVTSQLLSVCPILVPPTSFVVLSSRSSLLLPLPSLLPPLPSLLPPLPSLPSPLPSLLPSLPSFLPPLASFLPPLPSFLLPPLPPSRLSYTLSPCSVSVYAASVGDQNRHSPSLRSVTANHTRRWERAIAGRTRGDTRHLRSGLIRFYSRFTAALIGLREVVAATLIAVVHLAPSSYPLRRSPLPQPTIE